MIKFGKVLSGVALGAIVGLSSLSPAFAAETSHVNSAKTGTQQASSCITQEEGKTVALKQLPGTFKSVELKDNMYTFLIHGKDNKDHHVKVDAKTGKVTKIETVTQVKVFTQTEAKTIALKQLPGTFKSVEHKDNMYTFLIHGKDNKDHHVKVDAKTGKVTKIETVTQVKVFTQTEAKTIALKQLPGTFKSVEHKDNMYTFLIHGKDNKDHHVKVDAKTGKVTKIETVTQVKVFTQTEAKTIALKQLPGTFKSVEHKDNMYTFLIHGKDNKDHHVKVDAKTGACSYQ
ncbi:PepSY domain-containing protein [Priestia aryabhattai]|uniref:PepSY domain-containing protein n=1 Tax=Priestia aryabhattai TaxID=412384 RepID=UPI0036D8A9D8